MMQNVQKTIQKPVSGGTLRTGIFGNGLSNAVYLPDGAVLLDLHCVEDYFYWQRLFVNLAALRGLAHYVVDLYKYRHSYGETKAYCVVPEQYSRQLALDFSDRMAMECHYTEPSTTSLNPVFTEPGLEEWPPHCPPFHEVNWPDDVKHDSELPSFQYSR
eukprot:480843-Amphidinium_carterae.1